VNVVALSRPSGPPDHADGDRGAATLGRRVVSAAALAAAEARRAHTGDTLATALAGLDLGSAEEIARALAQGEGIGVVDLAKDPPDPELADPSALGTYFAHRTLPWRRVGALTAYVTPDPTCAEPALRKLAEGDGMALRLVVPPSTFDQALADVMAPEIADRAARRAPWSASVRSLPIQRIGIVLALALIAVFVAAFPALGLAALGLTLLVLSLATTVARIAALVASRPMTAAPVQPVSATAGEDLPAIALLVPLYREARVVPELVSHLARLRYPPGRLDVKLLLERADAETIAAVQGADLPPWISPLILPDGVPRTKPRALNAALDFCSAEIVGILDAEDRPDPDQLLAIAAEFAGAPPDVACAQCQLSYFNARENWLSRCFQIEYSIWFDVLLRGWQRLGLPVPLGGTSVYFRRSVLVACGAWDAHNVTEDADLGMRLARRGFRTAIVSSTTFEEANCRAIPWIRQRSRWLKGYLLTWLSHMRRPHELWRDLGPAGFLGFQVLFLGGAASYLAMPLFWAALAVLVTSGTSVYGAVMPGWALWTLGASLLVGQAVMLASAVLALRRRRMAGLTVWVPTLLLYWSLGAAAAWKAVVEIVVAPYYWDKTCHGVSRLFGRGGAARPDASTPGTPIEDGRTPGVPT